MNIVIIQKLKDLGPKMLPMASPYIAKWEVGFEPNRGYMVALSRTVDKKLYELQLCISLADAHDYIHDLERLVTSFFYRSTRNIATQEF